MNEWRELTFPIESLAGKVLDIEDGRADVVTDPLRWQILETLGTGMSVAELSNALGVTDARLLYHLGRLEQAGVVRLEDDISDARSIKCLPRAGKLRVRRSTEQSDQPQEAIPAEVVRDFNQAFREVAEGLFDPAKQITVTQNRARLSEEQAAEFSRRLLEVIEDYFPPGKGDRTGIKYGFYGVLTPIDLHPLSDIESN